MSMTTRFGLKPSKSPAVMFDPVPVRNYYSSSESQGHGTRQYSMEKKKQKKTIVVDLVKRQRQPLSAGAAP